MALKITLYNGAVLSDVSGMATECRQLKQLELIQRQLDRLSGDYRCNAVRPYDFYVRFINVLVTMPSSMSINMHCSKFAFLNTQLDTQFNICEFLDDLYKNSPGQLTLQVRFR